MLRIFYLLFILLLFLQCSNNNDSQVNSNDTTTMVSHEEDDFGYESLYPDGTYCVDVDYYNPNTGRTSNYTLTAEVENNAIVQINFPNGGYIDDEIIGGELNDNGEASITNNKGYQYDLKIVGEGGSCFENVPMAEQCQGTTEDGDQCQNMTDNPSGYCWQHEDQE